MQTAPYLLAPLGYQQFTVDGAAMGLPDIPAAANYAIFVCVTEAVNWRDDGTAPTASTGMPLAVSTYYTFAQRPLSSVQLIAQSSSATCNVSYYA